MQTLRMFSASCLASPGESIKGCRLGGIISQEGGSSQGNTNYNTEFCSCNFRPVNVKSSWSGIATNTTVSYGIRTNISLFEEYLKDCEVLSLSVVDEELPMIVGLVTIPELSTLIWESPHQHYFPIMNEFGNRIGDLHVEFSLQVIHQFQNAHCFTNHITSSVKSVQEMSEHRVMTGEENAIHGQRKKPKKCHKHYKSPLKTEILPTNAAAHTYGIYKSQRSKENQAVPDSVISKILEQGQRLRDAMVRSILEDDIYNGIDVLQSGSLTDKMLDTWHEGRKVFFDDTKVIDFLSGKNL
jgi:hypothetical protein